MSEADQLRISAAFVGAYVIGASFWLYKWLASGSVIELILGCWMAINSCHEWRELWGKRGKRD